MEKQREGESDDRDGVRGGGGGARGTTITRDRDRARTVCLQEEASCEEGSARRSWRVNLCSIGELVVVLNLMFVVVVLNLMFDEVVTDLDDNVVAW